MRFSATQARQITGNIGNGNSVATKLSQAGSFVKDLVASTATVSGQPFEVDVNSADFQAPVGDNFIAVGTDYTITFDDGENPVVTVSPGSFEIVDPVIEAFPIQTWSDIGGGFVPWQDVWNNTGKTITCQFSDIDAAGSQVAAWDSHVPSAITRRWQMVHTGGTPPTVIWNGTTNRMGVAWSLTSQMTLSTTDGNPVTNDDYVYSAFSITIPQQNAQCVLDDRIIISAASFGSVRTLRIDNVQVGGNLPVNQPITLIIKKSASAAFGLTEVWIDDVLFGTRASYFPTIPASILVGNGSMTQWATSYNKKGNLSTAEQTALHNWLQNRGNG